MNSGFYLNLPLHKSHVPTQVGVSLIKDDNGANFLQNKSLDVI